MLSSPLGTTHRQLFTNNLGGNTNHTTLSTSITPDRPINSNSTVMEALTSDSTPMLVRLPRRTILLNRDIATKLKVSIQPTPFHKIHLILARLHRMLWAQEGLVTKGMDTVQVENQDIWSPHPFSQQEPPHSPSPQGSQSYFQREPYPPRAHSHRHQGSFDENTVKVSPGSEMAPVAGEGPSPSHRGSLPKHPLSPMDHNQLHPAAAGHAPPPPSNVPHPYSEQHRRSVPGGDLEDPSRRFSSPPPPPPPGAMPPHPSQQRHSGQPPSPPQHQAPDSVLPIESHPGTDPNANPSPHDLVPRTLKHLENRLHFVEDAYMSLRQFAKELQGAQAAQDQTIAWMRDRIDQLSEANTPRGMRPLLV
ncbi:hypothetical protein BGZ58_001903 [Dissophora ornata]|nr:hypothetical protein BGZ58_001903 [Dissophora ornata]